MDRTNNPRRPGASRTPSRSAAAQSRYRRAGERGGDPHGPAPYRQPQGRRPAGPGGRRGPKRRSPAGLIIACLCLIALIIAAVLILRPRGGDAQPQQTAPATQAVETTDLPAATDASATAEAVVQTFGGTQTDAPVETDRAAALSAMLAGDGNDLTALSADQMTTVTDLSVNTALPSDWVNILLLGSDERSETDSARTDAMIICSINPSTGQVKLTSIMRDLAVEFTDLGDELNGFYRINAANYFGGERLAMKTVNECFGMNIEHYVRVDFYGFQQIAHQLGGIDIDITKEEMEQINENIVDAYKAARRNGIDDSNLPRQYLTEYGPGTHLDGRQTLGYARIRKLDGGDYARAERQRKVLIALANKMRDADITTVLNAASSMLPYVKTDLDPSFIVQIATTVLQKGVSVTTCRLPVNDTYKEETRQNQSMLWDCDWATNASELYNFIYNS